MTIKECAKEKGIETSCSVWCHRWGEIEVCFYNTKENQNDATSFDIPDPLGKYGLAELSKLYENFCEENDILRNTVNALVLLNVAETYEDLVVMC